MSRKGKRTLDNSSEKVSPPNKMSNRNRRNSESNEILNKLEAIEARFANLEKEVAEIKSTLKGIEAIKAEVEDLKVSLSGYQRLEMEVKRRCALIKGLKFGTTEKFETRVQTKAALATFFGNLGMTPHLVDYHRLGGRKDEGDGSGVCVRVQFADVDQKFDLFEKLKSKGREFSRISILTDYPSFQQAEFKKLSEKAFNIRKETPGTKTRVVPKGVGLVLQRRANAQDRWTVVSQ